MKNIHLIESKEKSTLLYNPRHKSFCIRKEPDGMWINDGKVSGADFWSVEKAMNNGFYPYNIYITSDEEIKEGGWVIQVNFEKTNTQLIKCVTKFQAKIANDKNGSYTKNKIILTTDPDLIKEGVQAIDDEFLEWFVKNPSCEEVPIITVKYLDKPTYRTNIGFEKWRIGTIPQGEPKQETLEEAAEKLYLSHENNELLYGHSEDLQLAYKAGILDGAKWQAERMYSEEEVKEILMKTDRFLRADLDLWFEQFKKK